MGSTLGIGGGGAVSTFNSSAGGLAYSACAGMLSNKVVAVAASAADQAVQRMLMVSLMRWKDAGRRPVAAESSTARVADGWARSKGYRLMGACRGRQPGPHGGRPAECMLKMRTG